MTRSPAISVARDRAAPSRNGPCPCGSGRKFKQCCAAQAARQDAAQALALRHLAAGRFEQALAELDAVDGAASVQDPGRDSAGGAAAAPLRRLRAEALIGLRRADEAADLLQDHVAKNATDGMAWALLGQAFSAAKKTAASLHALQQAAALLPRHAAVLNNLGNVLHDSGHCVAAADCFRRALALDDSLPAAHGNLGGALLATGSPNEALGCYATELARHGAYPESYSNLLLAMHYADSVDPVQLAQAHLRYGDVIEAPWRKLTCDHARLDDPLRPLRVGWVSADLRQHSVSFFLEPLLNALDGAAFTLLAYSNHPGSDAVTERLRARFAVWRDIHELDDEQVAALVRQDGVDILVDLGGHTAGNRLPVFARRPAPLQLSWLGYPGTTGLRSMDWRITDATADPPGQTESWHSEKLWRLEGGFLCYQPADDAPQPMPRASGSAPVFGSMNNHVKLSPTAIRLWSRLLLEVPESRLMLKLRGQHDAATADLYLERLASLGVARHRVDVIGRLPGTSEHLCRYGEVDVALDSYPYHGTTTTCDALWMGVPVVTLAGRHHASRVGASILYGLDLAELVAETEDEFVTVAAALARDFGRRQQMRVELRARMAASPLMDASGFGKRFGEALRGMWRRAWDSAAAERSVASAIAGPGR